MLLNMKKFSSSSIFLVLHMKNICILAFISMSVTPSNLLGIPTNTMCYSVKLLHNKFLEKMHFDISRKSHAKANRDKKAYTFPLE